MSIALNNDTMMQEKKDNNKINNALPPTKRMLLKFSLRVHFAENFPFCSLKFYFITLSLLKLYIVLRTHKIL
jgi:hypothetical protein